MLLVLIFVSMSLSGIILAFLTNSHPVMFFLNVFLIYIIGVLSALFANIFETSVTQGSLAAYAAANFPMTILIFTYYPMYNIVFSILLTVVFFVKTN